MNFFDNIFDISDTSDYSISGLSNELVCLNIYNAFIKHNKGFLVVTSSTFEANNLYQMLSNYTSKVLFFPMDDFLTSEAIAISPEFKAERINTLNMLAKNSNYIVVTNLMGALRYLPAKNIWKSSKITLKKGDTVDRDKLLLDLYNLGYERDAIVNGTGKLGVRGYIIDIFPISYDNAVRIELWGDEIDSIRSFDVLSQRSIEQLSEISIYPATELLLTSKQREDGLARIKKEAAKVEKQFRDEHRPELASRIKHQMEALREQLEEFGIGISLEKLLSYYR